MQQDILEMDSSDAGSAHRPKQRGRQPAVAEIRRLAARLGATTRKAVAEALAAAGCTRRPVDVDAVLAAVDEAARQRKERIARKFAQRFGHRPHNAPSHPSVAPYEDARPSLQQRLIAQKKAAVRAVARQLFRHGAAGGHTMRVTFAQSGAQVDYQVDMGRNWHTYAGAYKSWAANEDDHHLCVPPDWRPRVQRRGLASLGGRMTLDAHELEPVGAARLYAATWAGQGRGFTVRVQRGYLALLDGEHYHADTLEQAVMGVQRKVRARLSGQGQRKPVFDNVHSTVEDFVRRYQRWPVLVTLDDARKTGSCEFGIRSWCERVGLDHASGVAPLAAVLDAFARVPQVEVRRAVVEAVRRARAARRRTNLSVPAIAG